MPLVNTTRSSHIWAHPLISALLCLSLQGFSESQEVHVYKTVGDLKIKANVWRYGTGKSRPVVVWIHGGGFVGHSPSYPMEPLPDGSSARD